MPFQLASLIVFALAAGAAPDAQAAATRARRAIEQFPLVPAQKHLVAEYRGDPAWRAVRPPMTELSAEDGAALFDAVSGAGLDVESLAG